MIFTISVILFISGTATAASFFTDVYGTIIMSEGFDYNDQDTWGGMCVSDNEGRQSPIDIVTRATIDQELPKLKFAGWSTHCYGEFTNNGHSVQFNPRPPCRATTSTKYGVYALQQLHMHWGRRREEGSEHTINGHASELEIHFVHTKKDSEQSGPTYMVIAVLASVAEAPIVGPWEKLDIGKVEYYDDWVNVKRFHYDSLLPANCDYYMYSGSLTTPPCTEEVLWHVMKHKIHVPAKYLRQLRMIHDQHGQHLTHNFRQTQQLKGRKVFA
jgi:carbonic anhydrase